MKISCNGDETTDRSGTFARCLCMKKVKTSHETVAETFPDNLQKNSQTHYSAEGAHILVPI